MKGVWTEQTCHCFMEHIGLIIKELWRKSNRDRWGLRWGLSTHFTNLRHCHCIIVCIQDFALIRKGFMGLGLKGTKAKKPQEKLCPFLPVKKGIGIDCAMPICKEIDSWEHMIKCPFYETKFDKKWISDMDIAKYIIKASQERMTKVRRPLKYENTKRCL